MTQQDKLLQKMMQKWATDYASVKVVEPKKITTIHTYFLEFNVLLLSKQRVSTLMNTLSINNNCIAIDHCDIVKIYCKLWFPNDYLLCLKSMCTLGPKKLAWIKLIQGMSHQPWIIE